MNMQSFLEQVEQDVKYALSKQVPAMLDSGFHIHTTYGDIVFDNIDEVEKIAALVKKLLERRLKLIEREIQRAEIQESK